MKVAVIGIGSNSVRMLVCEVSGGELHRLRREREGTRLFAGLDEKRNLSRESMENSCRAVKAMAEAPYLNFLLSVNFFMFYLPNQL